MTVKDSERATQLLLAVMRGKRKQDVVRNKTEAEAWDALVSEVKEIRAAGLEVGIPNP
jgi:hypothetical protein